MSNSDIDSLIQINKELHTDYVCSFFNHFYNFNIGKIVYNTILKYPDYSYYIIGHVTIISIGHSDYNIFTPSDFNTLEIYIQKNLYNFHCNTLYSPPFHSLNKIPIDLNMIEGEIQFKLYEFTCNQAQHFIPHENYNVSFDMFESKNQFTLPKVASNHTPTFITHEDSNISYIASDIILKKRAKRFNCHSNSNILNTNIETPNTETPNTKTPNTETPNTETFNTETLNTKTSNTETPDTETLNTNITKKRRRNELEQLNSIVTIIDKTERKAAGIARHKITAINKRHKK